MEGDMINLIRVYLSAVISLCYCYWIRKFVPSGTRRLLSVLPIICFYLFIPLNFSSVHLRGNIGFFFAWLANFKLLLFAFDKGPLSADPSISLGRFIAVACLPIKIQQKQPPSQPPSSKTAQNNPRLLPSNPIQPHQNGKNPPPDPSQESKSFHFETDPSSITPNTSCQSKQNSSPNYPSKGHHTPLLQYAIKGLLLAVLVKIYDYSDHIHPIVIMGMYCFHIYFMMEIILAILAALARTMLGMELEPQFKDPLLSTSLQDFWGRRWNLMVTSILRPTVYEPTLKAAGNVVGPQWAPLPAVLGTFVVSGLMHELILYYMGRLEPTLRMTCFFVLHGLCLTAEIALKKTLTARFRLPRFVSGPLTAGFVLATCFWLFLPEFIRCRIDVKAFEEYAALGALVKNLTSSVRGFF
ncbi:probable long-chain-alcohol O-fatty-acyltransferase 2 [Gastrolobium bilobum]|uniref:probable long-chain-alcohol O-fatty-acyltransferase 2 n=1 Tax=Gastrolobium bilobum TaxID=150636 RepID=UPI002AB07FDA|nr:probable long-chain-alcohol O-fatty-acyltransferase 2 [Gastrolobium bilobum]